MATTSPVALYLDEFIAGFEQRQSLLRDAVTNEAMVKGLSATFLVVTSNRSAVTRGANGLIPATAETQSQITCTLAEAHDLTQKTGFNVFTGQADQRRIMQETGQAVINRDVDNVILTELANATVTAGSAAVLSKAVINKAITKLGNAAVPFDGNIWAVITPAAWAYLSDLPSFSSRDYRKSASPIDDGPRPQVGSYLNVNWLVHPNLTGVGTSSATMFMFHKSAIGHAVDKAGIQAKVGYNEEQDYSFARHSVFHGAKLLQNSGIVKILHDDSAYS